MKPINFPGTNKVYTAPKGMDGVEDLHVKVEVIDGRQSNMSAWALDDEEREAIASGRGFIVLEIMGATHPVVGLYVGETSDE